MVTIAIEHVSPFVAQQWVNWLIQDINATMKQRDVLEANKSTSFLTQQLEQTKIADIRAVLYKLVEEQTKTIMFANVRDEYVFKTIDPAIIPEQKFKPKRALICILGTLIGVFLSSVLVLIKYFLKQDKE
jgi:LPS O-antigen subunit length determinant protein (WzzB/FepE family)